MTNYTSTTCTWKIPYCEFSVWGGGQPATPPGSSGSTGGGGGGSSTVSPECNDNKDNDYDGLIDYPDDLGCKNLNDEDEADIVCTWTWECSEWSSCENKEVFSTRTCVRSDSCETKLDNRDVSSITQSAKPNEKKSCTSGEEIGGLAVKETEIIRGAPSKAGWIVGGVILVILVGLIVSYMLLTNEKKK